MRPRGSHVCVFLQEPLRYTIPSQNIGAVTRIRSALHYRNPFHRSRGTVTLTVPGKASILFLQEVFFVVFFVTVIAREWKEYNVQLLHKRHTAHTLHAFFTRWRNSLRRVHIRP